MSAELVRQAVEWMALSLAGGTLVASCTWAALRITPRQSARTRFALWFAVLISIAAFPLLTLVQRSNSAGQDSRAWLTIPQSWAWYLVAGWALMAFAGAVRIVAGLWQLRRLRGAIVEIPKASLPACVRESMSSFDRRRGVRIGISDSVRVPTAIGFFRPTVIIPRWLIDELPSHDLNQVVLHELAHLSRRDDWTNLAQKILRAMLFFHPAVWFVDRQLSLEREMACDEAVVAVTGNPRSYAECLAVLVEKTLGRRRAALALAAVHRVQQVTARVIRILEPPRASAGRGWTWAVGAMAAVAMGSSVFVAGGAPLIGFRVAPQVAQQRTAAPVARTQMHPLVIPAAAHIVTGPVKQRVRAPQRVEVRVQPNEQHALRASANRVPPIVTGHVVPAKASWGNAQQEQQDVVIFTMFSTSQGGQVWNVEVWQLTVRQPAAPQPAPRKTT